MNIRPPPPIIVLAAPLLESLVIPSRTEMLLEGKLAKRAKSFIGMIEPRSSRSNAARQGFSVARVVVKPDNRTVPLRVLNASTTQLELVAGENLADFCPLIESCLSQLHVCGAVGNKTTPQVISDKIESIIDPSLQGGKRGKLKNLLLEFSDVFDENLRHTTILTHEINTGNSTPIEQHPRRIIVVKKKDGEMRFCIDYRKLNSVTIGQVPPLPRVDDILDSLGDAQYFSTLDLKSAY